jgi:hypothetical protein
VRRDRPSLNHPAAHLADYFREHRFSEAIARDALTMTFEGFDRPLEAYTRALTESGFVIDALREPRPSADVVRRFPDLAPAAGKPFFLHLRCFLAR